LHNQIAAFGGRSQWLNPINRRLPKGRNDNSKAEINEVPRAGNLKNCECIRCRRKQGSKPECYAKKKDDTANLDAKNSPKSPPAIRILPIAT